MWSDRVWKAAQNGNLDELLAGVASASHLLDTPNRHEWQRTPMYIAAHSGHVEIVEKLIELGSTTIDLPDHAGRTPLYTAAASGHVSMIEALVRLGSKAIDTPNKLGYTPMNVAAQGGHAPVIEALVRLGSAAIDIPNNSGSTPLYTTVIGNSLACMTSLKAVGVSNFQLGSVQTAFVVKLMQSKEDEEEVLEVRYRVYFMQSLLGRLLFQLTCRG